MCFSILETGVFVSSPPIFKINRSTYK
uniref:Uncharacterized protein n=1 Tax=Anguilla anguilla TaxID=7936 RepID=A0A0E9UPU2_ANGAN